MIEMGSKNGHIFDTVTFSVCGIIFFVVYWIILCPLTFVTVHKYYGNRYDDWYFWWPVMFWLIALGVFIVMLCLALVIWRTEESNEEFARLRPKCQHEKNRCFIVINEKENRNSGDIVEVRTNGVGVKYEKHRHTEVPKSRRPKLELKLRPLSCEYDSRQATPLTPRELFFKDMYEAANSSQASTPKMKETEIFVANVPKHFSESNVVFMYIPNSESAESGIEPVDEPGNDDVFDCEL